MPRLCGTITVIDIRESPHARNRPHPHRRLTRSRISRCWRTPTAAASGRTGVETFDYESAFDSNDAVGAAFTQQIREGWRVTEYQGEITTFDPGAAWGARTVGGSYAMVVEYRLTPVDGGTAVITVVEVDSSSWFIRLMGFLFGWLTRSLGRKHLRKLKDLVEAA